MTTPSSDKPLEDAKESIELLRPSSEETQDFLPFGSTPAPVAPPPRSKQPTKVKLTALGDFRLVGKLGEGSMGTVYKARQMSTKRLVALKVVSQAVAKKPGFIERFRREVRILARLSHPHIVHYLAAGTAHGFTYLAMELADSGSLSHYLEKLGVLPVGDAISIVGTCAQALQYAHEQNLVHRDVKPDNILFNKMGLLKLTDLGLARTTDDSDTSLTRTGTGIGTPLYAAPEQIRDAKRADARSDIYALGCVFYHCLTGQPPFQSANILQLIMVKESGKYPLASEVNPKVPATLNRILARLMDKNLDHRYQSCAEFIHELDMLKQASEKLSFLPE